MILKVLFTRFRIRYTILLLVISICYSTTLQPIQTYSYLPRHPGALEVWIFRDMTHKLSFLMWVSKMSPKSDRLITYPRADVLKETDTTKKKGKERKGTQQKPV